ncbi:MAG TPA: hypothetical protein VGM14_24890 [Streptosporangiaceae bacterium]
MLNGVAVTSARNAWAVGETRSKTVILHWNGTRWQRLPSPSPGSGAVLSGVSATSTANAWAVGLVGSRSLAERWNEKA